MHSDLTVIGTGSLLMGDDGIGVRIVEQLAGGCGTAALGCDAETPSPLPSPGGGGCGIEYLDGSVGGLRLLNWIEQANRLLFVDGARFGDPAAPAAPGQCRLLTLEEVLGHATGQDAQFSLHQTDLVSVLRLARQFYRVPPAWLLAIQVESVQMAKGLSPTLSAALPRLADTVRRLALRLARKA